MKIVKLNSLQFDKYALRHKYKNYYQTSMYASVMSKFDYETQFIGIVDNSNKLIGASLIVYKEVFMKNKIAYAPRGLLFNYEDSKLTQELEKCLKKDLGKQGFMMLRIDPYIPLTIRDKDGAVINFNNKGNEIIENIKSAGFTYKGKTLFFETEKPRWEGLITLHSDTKNIFDKLEKRTKNKIRKAINNGVIVYKDESQNINKLYQFVGNKEKKPLEFYKELKEQFDKDIDVYYAKIKTDTFLINSRKNYEKEMEYNDQLAERIQDLSLDSKERELYLNKKIQSDKLVTAYKNNLLKATELLKDNPGGIIIGGILVIKYDNAAYIFTEGFDEKYSNLCGNYLIKWKMITDYAKEQLKYINLNAVVGEFERENKYSGLNESKLGYNTIVTEYIGEFDIILNNFTYNLYQKINK